MASYQRVALYILFDAVERDLSNKIRAISGSSAITDMLTAQERMKAVSRLEQRRSAPADRADDSELVHGLDLGDKIAILMRHKSKLEHAESVYYIGIRQNIENSIDTRNAVMHGRPLTTDEYALGFSLAQTLIATPSYWPNLAVLYKKFTDSPNDFISSSIELLDDDYSGEVLNNLPPVDYDDTGFLPRHTLEQELKKKYWADTLTCPPKMSPV